MLFGLNGSLSTGSPAGELSAKLNLLTVCSMYSQAHVRHTSMSSMTCQGTEVLEKSGQTSGLTAGNGTGNLSRQ